MTFDDAPIIGSALIILIGFLGGYTMLLRIRDHFSEQPDPKLTYTRLTDHEKLGSLMAAHVRELKEEIDRFRQNVKHDHDALRSGALRSSGELNELIQKNTASIASLEAHCDITRQRLSELTLKTDKLIERTHA